MLNLELQQFFSKMDNPQEALTYNNLASKIREVIEKEDPRSIEDNAEIFAFNVYVDVEGANSWGSYFGPMFSFNGAGGVTQDFPSRDIITHEVLDYWDARRKTSINPLLKARYADLLIEFSGLVKKRRVELMTVKDSIDCHLEAVRHRFLKELDAKDAIRRALDLSLKFSVTEKIEDIFTMAINLEKEIAQDEMPGLWGFVMRWFVLDSRIKVSEEAGEHVVNEMISRNARLLEKGELWPLRCSTMLLTDYYKITKDYTALRMILGEYRKAVRSLGASWRGSLNELHHLQDLEALYELYLVSDDIKSELNEIKGLLQNFRLEPNGQEFKEISASAIISIEKINKFLGGIFQTEQISEVIKQVAINFLTSKERDRKLLEEISKKYVFASLATNNIFDKENRLVAQLAPITQDQDSHLRRHSTQNSSIASVFLERVLDEFIKRYSVDEFSSYLSNSVGFIGLNNDLLNKILKSYWAGDYLAFSHLCVPLIESAIRKILLSGGASVTKSNKDGGYDYCSLNVLLDRPHTNAIFQAIFDQVGADVIYTLQITLIDNLGLNIRNNVAHGICQADFIDRKYSDSLLKILFLLSLIKNKE